VPAARLRRPERALKLGLSTNFARRPARRSDAVSESESHRGDFTLLVRVCVTGVSTSTLPSSLSKPPATPGAWLLSLGSVANEPKERTRASSLAKAQTAARPGIQFLRRRRDALELLSPSSSKLGRGNYLACLPLRITQETFSQPTQGDIRINL
jgi:hypothetical protein